MQGALSNLKEETQEASSDPEVETQQIISEHKQDEAGPAAGSMDLGGPVRKLTISDNVPPIMSSRTRSRRVHTGEEGAALQCSMSTIKEGDEEGDEESVCRCATVVGAR